MEKRIIGILSGKGGVGKSTISINLCALAAYSKQSVLLIDTDINNPCVGLHLGMWHSALGFQDVLNKKAKLEEAVAIHPTTGIRLVPSSIEYGKATKLDNLKQVLGGSSYETIILDCPPGTTENTEQIIQACTEILVVVTPDVPSVTSGTKLIELAKEFKVKVTGVIVNRAGNKPYEMHPKEIETITETRICTIIPEDPAVPESIAAKIPLVLYKPKGQASRAIAELAGIVFNKPLGGGMGHGGFFSGIREWIRHSLHI
jgi:septum site-determining protein MinD